MVELQSQGKPHGCHPGITTTGALMAHDEFPELTHEAKCVLMNTMKGIDVSKPYWDRRFAAAVIREAKTQAGFWSISKELTKVVRATDLEAIADNLHALPPPTREQMEEALQHLIDMYGDRVAGESTDEHLQTLRAGIAHHCKVQP
jgi:hypothetical protein